MLNPCKDCPARHTACHDTCEQYKAWKAAHDAEIAYTKTMTQRQSVYHEDSKDRKRNARRAHPFGQK